MMLSNLNSGNYYADTERHDEHNDVMLITIMLHLIMPRVIMVMEQHILDTKERKQLS